MSALRVSLFSKLHLNADTAVITVDAGKAQELLCYLLLNRERPHHREALAGLLWGETSDAQAKQYLRKALWQLQQALTAGQCAGLVHTDGDWLGINPAFPLWLDVTQLEQAYREVQCTPSAQLRPEQAQQMEDAITWYGCGLLEGWYQEWCLYERERLHHFYLVLLDKLMGYCEVTGQYEAGLLYGARILRDDSARERTHRRMMRLYYRSGRRTEALRQFERCATILHQELGVRPAQSTCELYETICADRPLPWPAPPPPRASAHPAIVLMAPDLPDLLRQLHDLQTTLHTLEHQVQRHINHLQQSIHPDAP